jgi:dipeptidyl-peptidase-4
VKRFVVLLVCVALISSFSVSQTVAPTKKPLTIEAIVADGGLTGRAPESIQWSPDSTKVSYILRDDADEHAQFWLVNAATGEKQMLISDDKLAPLVPSLHSIQDDREKEQLPRYHVALYQWAPDSKHLLFNTHGHLWMYSLENGTAVQFTASSEPVKDPKFSPNGNNVAYVRQHNLFVRPISGDKEKQLTNSKGDNLLNGEVDWLYAEELAVRSNFVWSPNSNDIAFVQMDETRVPTYPITDWIPTHPNVDMEKYPKAGDPNPSVRLGVVSASGGRTQWIALTDDKDIYVPRFGWVRDGVVWAEVLNRTQDRLDLYFADTSTGRARKVLTESVPETWVNVNDDFRILKSGDRFLWSSWRDGHTHLYLYSFDERAPGDAEAKLNRQLTQGEFEVLASNAINESAGVVYFTSNKDDVRRQSLYSIRLDGSGLRRVSKVEGTHETNFADDGQHYVDTFSSLQNAPNMSVCNAGECKTFWESRPVADYDLAPPKFLEFKASDDSVLYGQLSLPPENVAKARIPVIVYLYGGPADQLVQDAWPSTEVLFNEVLVQHGFAVFTVDNRGTPARDRGFQTAIRHQFGEVELRDQLSSLDQLLEQFPQLDRSHIGIWGWSNGGSMTLYALTHSQVFKAGVAVAPVTDARNYDTTYMERYLGLPDDNPKGYNQTALSKVAESLHGTLLLAHGTSDDNVHFQNSVQFISALIQAGKQFDFMLYPGKTHGITGAAARGHLFHMMQEHFERELK